MAAIDKEIVDLLKEGCYRGLFAYPRRVHLKHIHSSKEEQWKQARNRHESTKRVHGVNPFQNGRHIPAKICSQTGRLYDKTRFKGRISNCPSEQNIENLPSLHLEGCTLPIHLLPFGLSSSGRIFTKAMKPVIAFLRAMEIRSLISLDDIFIMANSHELAIQNTDLVIQVLTSLGFVINFLKYILIPSRVLPYLGFEVNSDLMKLFLLREKFLNLKRFTIEIMFQVPTASCVASFLGLCQLTMPAILKTPFYIRAIQRDHKGHSPPRATCFLQNQGHPFSGGNKRAAMVDRFSPLKQ